MGLILVFMRSEWTTETNKTHDSCYGSHHDGDKKREEKRKRKRDREQEREREINSDINNKEYTYEFQQKTGTMMVIN